jgi:hypothetical protein
MQEEWRHKEEVCRYLMDGSHFFLVVVSVAVVHVFPVGFFVV